MKNNHLLSPDALYLVDGSYLLYRSYFAIKPLHTSTGIPTNAVLGFCRAIKKLIDTFKPTHLAIVWDSKGGSFRNTIYPDYKFHRQATPSDLMSQKQLIMQFIDIVGIPNVALEGYEADDLLATLVRNHLAQQTVLVCADKDMYQLLDSNKVIITDVFKDEVVDEELYTQTKGYPPTKIPFYHALIGDSSDNIPGVKGIGEKSATELVKTFDSLDHLYQNLNKIDKSRIKTALQADEANARLSLELFSLAQAPLHHQLQDFSFSPSQWSRAHTFFQTYEFASLAGTISSPTTITQQTTLTQQEQTWETTIINTDEALKNLHQKLCAAKIYSIDTETSALEWQKMTMIGMSFCIEASQAFYLPFGHPDSDANKNLDVKKTLHLLKDTLENPNHHKVLHHAKFDEHVLLRYGIKLQGVVFDTLIAANLVKENWPTINLKDLSMRLLNERMVTYEEIVGKQYKHFGQLPIDRAAQYGAHDARQTLLLMPILEKKLKAAPELERYFHEIDLPFSDLLLRMEEEGISLDVHRLELVNKKVQAELKEIEAKLTAAMPMQQLSIDNSINFNSPQQIESLLFDVLQLPIINKTSKGRRSTDQEVLEKLSHLHFVPGLLIKYRELTKLINTYTQPLSKEVYSVTGRVHTTFSQTLVATGRLSSSNPNLQNIPASSDYGHAIRETFVAAPGHLLLSADYSQIELRILAHVANDQALCRAFHENKDIHQQTASELLEIPLSTVTQEQRQLGKQLNFSIMYGLTPFGLSQEMKIPLKEARLYIDNFFRVYHQVKDWMDRTIESGKELGYVSSLWGRRRYIPELRDKNKTVFEGGRRAAINSPIQGSTADLVKVAMLRIDELLRLQKLSAKILLQIHDEIILEIPENEIEIVEKIVLTTMEQIVQWQIPLKVALRKGKNWGEITK
ncbi:DNA polymerase I [Candidatus Dependentiae bacterium]|nr:DNA polymerase I [Candidatus Dependentiae bacterium]